MLLAFLLFRYINPYKKVDPLHCPRFFLFEEPEPAAGGVGARRQVGPRHLEPLRGESAELRGPTGHELETVDVVVFAGFSCMFLIQVAEKRVKKKLLEIEELYISGW